MKCDLLSRNVRSLVLKNNLPSEYTFSSHVALVYKDGEENVFFYYYSFVHLWCSSPLSGGKHSDDNVTIAGAQVQKTTLTTASFELASSFPGCFQTNCLTSTTKKLNGEVVKNLHYCL